MSRRPTIDGVERLTLTSHGDERGSVTEIYREQWFTGRPRMVQSNLSISKSNVLRGLHFHRKQADLWVVQMGSAFVGLYDLRTGSPTEGRAEEIDMDADEGLHGLYIPPGVAHGFFARTDLRLLYFVDRPFSGDDEFGVAWDDPGLGIRWPVTAPTVSERDRSNPSLEVVGAAPPSYPSGPPQQVNT